MDSRLSSRASLIYSAYQEYRSDPAWAEFFSLNDLGLPAAIVVAYNLGTLNEAGEKAINETHDAICEAFGIDNLIEIDNITDLIEIAEMI